MGDSPAVRAGTPEGPAVDNPAALAEDTRIPEEGRHIPAAVGVGIPEAHIPARSIVCHPCLHL